jgi:hypothetical protein
VGCAVLLLALTGIHLPLYLPRLEPFKLFVCVFLFVVGVYSTIRGAFGGSWLNRTCAGLTAIFWVWCVCYVFWGNN